MERCYERSAFACHMRIHVGKTSYFVFDRTFCQYMALWQILIKPLHYWKWLLVSDLYKIKNMSPKSCIEVESSRIDVLLVTKYLQEKVTERSETPGEGKQLGLAQVTTFLALHIESSLDREASQQLLPKLSNASAEEIIISSSRLYKMLYKTCF